MVLEWLKDEFVVAKWQSRHKIEDLGAFSFWAQTDHETSLLCPAECLPGDAVETEEGWCGFRIAGQMDFSQIGILAKISGCLAENAISIFAVSTFNTDYIFVKQETAVAAQKALAAAGWEFI